MQPERSLCRLLFVVAKIHFRCEGGDGHSSARCPLQNLANTCGKLGEFLNGYLYMQIQVIQRMEKLAKEGFYGFTCRLKALLNVLNFPVTERIGSLFSIRVSIQTKKVRR
jgi:hypothetical protein